MHQTLHLLVYPCNMGYFLLKIVQVTQHGGPLSLNYVQLSMELLHEAVIFIHFLRPEERVAGEMSSSAQFLVEKLSKQEIILGVI